MATATFTVALDNSSDAAFRAWGSAVSAQIAAMGWVKTADTGQVDWTTAARGTGYEIWRTNDGISPTLYLKLLYANGDGVASPGIAPSIGWATNGAGTLTGTLVSPQFVKSQGYVSEGILRTCVISGTPSRLALALAVDASNRDQPILLVVERSVDATGAPTNAGAFLALVHTREGPNVWLPATGSGVPAAEPRLVSAVSSNASGVFGLDAGFGVVVPLAGGARPSPLGLMTYPVNDVTPFAQVGVSRYGTLRTYYALGNHFHRNVGPAYNADLNVRVAMLFE